MSALFGAEAVMDAFTIAFRLPNLARVLLGEGALTTAFLPVFVAEMRERGRESAAQLVWAVLICLSVVLSSLIVLFELLVFALRSTTEFPPETALLCDLTAIMLPYVLLICLAAQAGAVLNALRQFLWPALIPSILNLSWLIALWTIVPNWSSETSKVFVTAVCVVAGGVLQLIFPIPFLYANGMGYRSDWRLALDRVWTIGKNMLPVVIGLSIAQLNAILDSLIAWGFTQPTNGHSAGWLPDSIPYPLREGTVTSLYLGQRLYQFPLGVFGVALGTVLFPLLTSHAQRGEFDKLRADLSLGVRLIIAIGIPASAGLMLIAQPLSSLFFQWGKFDADAARMTGQMIAAYGSGVWAYCGLLILQRGFYSVGDRLTPMYTGIAAMLVNLTLNLTLIWPLGGQGLAFSTALVAALQCIAAALLLQKKVGKMLWNEIGLTGLKTFIATIAMSIATLIVQSIHTTHNILMGRAMQLLLPLATGAAVYLLTARLIRLNEPWILLRFRNTRSTTETEPVSDSP